MRFFMVIVATLCVLTSTVELLGRSRNGGQLPTGLNEEGSLIAQLATTPMRSDLWLSLYGRQSHMSDQQQSTILMMTYVTGGESPKDLGRRLYLLATRANLNDTDIAALAKGDIGSILRLGPSSASAIDTAYRAANVGNRIVFLKLVGSMDADLATRLRENSNTAP